MALLTIGIPVYFNAGSLAALGDRLLAVEASLAQIGVELELVMVDDGSGDSSYDVMQAVQGHFARCTLVRHTRNFGALVALKTALAHASGDAFVILSADLQDPPELVVEMATAWQAGAKYVICQRRTRQDPVGTRLFARAYYALVRRFVIPDYPKGGFDFSLMSSQLMSALRNAPKNVNFVLFAYWLGYKPHLISYDRLEREHGKSRWTFTKKLKLFIDTFLGFSVAPIRLISAIGALVAAASFAYGAFVVVAALLGIVPVQGFATIVVLITFLLGLIILFLGVIAEYLWRILHEVNRLPEGVVDEVKPR
jgi:polyisoprenyl-phosphate glycosyltransferase